MLQEDAETFQSQRQMASPYETFVQKNRDLIQSQNPDLSSTDIAIKLAVLWANMSNEQRLPYIRDSFSNKDPFSDEEEAAKFKKGNTYEEQLSESISDASLQISQFDHPTDPENYMIWLGSKVVNKFYKAHGYIPNELIDLFKNGQFVSKKHLLNQAEIETRFKELFPMLFNQISNQ